MVSTRDAFTQFGPRHIYTLTIEPESHDFRLVATPTSQIAPEGTIVNGEGGAAYNLGLILIGSGSDIESAVELSKRILHHYDNDLNKLAKASISELCQFRGIGEAKAIVRVVVAA